MATKQLGTRAEAQQRVLAEGVTDYTSWRDVDDRIKAVEKDIIRHRTATLTHDRPAKHGALLGEALSDIAKAGDVGLGILSAACVSCAFREGSLPNQSAGTGILALNCILGIDDSPFGCHHGLDDGMPSKLCAGYLAAKNAPWDVVKATLATLNARLANLEGPDDIRADFDTWLLTHDPDGKMDVYEQARAYAKACKAEETTA